MIVQPIRKQTTLPTLLELAWSRTAKLTMTRIEPMMVQRKENTGIDNSGSKEAINFSFFFRVVISMSEI